MYTNLIFIIIFYLFNSHSDLRNRHFTLYCAVCSKPRWNNIWYNTLCDPQIIIQSLGVLYIHSMHVCKVIRDTGIS